MHTVPKAELHVHLEGTAPPELVARIAARNGLQVPAGMLNDAGAFHYSDFPHFLATYDLAAGVIRTAQDYTDITYEYLASLAADHTLYAELTASPDHAAAVGLSLEQMLDGIAAGIDRARAEHGIEARILLVAVKSNGPRRAEAIAAMAAGRPGYVVGFSMAGLETIPATDFIDAYRLAADAGIGTTMHAGEWEGPASVRAALALPITRIDHGVRAVEDPALVRELAARGTVLTVCPTSNVVLGVYPGYEEHPLAQLIEAGVKVTLASDDPPYFGATLGGEYELAAGLFGLDEAQLRTLTATAIDGAFCDPELKAQLSARLSSSGSSHIPTSE